jgi:acetylornithine/succinyldiaminopimelate/putrescine aminotransferase
MHRGSPIIQFSPTLVTSEADIDHMVSALGEVLESMSAEYQAGSGTAQPIDSLTV